MVRKMRVALLTFILCTMVSGAHAAEPSAIGSWIGTLQISAGALRVYTKRLPN